MALIKCPECKRKVSDTAISCPHCGFEVRNYMEQLPPTPAKPTRKKTGIKKSIKNIFSLDWLDTLHDKISKIPIFGGCLSALFFLIFVWGACVGVLFLIMWLIFSLLEYNPYIALAVMLLAANIIAYFASYKWKQRKKWYFGLTLFVTILFIVFFISFLITCN